MLLEQAPQCIIYPILADILAQARLGQARNSVQSGVVIVSIAGNTL